jgi:hypothetical protein
MMAWVKKEDIEAGRAPGIPLEVVERLMEPTHHCHILETGNESWRFKNRA